MVQDNQEREIEYQLVDFYLESHKPLSIQDEPEDYGFAVQIDRSTDIEEDLVYITISIESKSGPESEPFFQAKTVSVFNIKDLDKVDDNISDDFISNLMAISYSTTRGYLMAFNKENFLGKSHLPLLTIQQIAEGLSKPKGEE